jgi:hypothetical protein
MVSPMRRNRIAIIAAAGALAAAGTGVAVATTTSDDPKQREQAVLDDAAKRLNIEASKLRDALGAAEDAQLDAEVKAGNLTQKQADAIKARRAKDGTVLGGPGPGFGLHLRGRGFGPPGGPHLRPPGVPGRGGPGDLLDAAATAIGISQDKLFDELRSGKTLSEVAKAHGKSFDDVKTAVTAALKKDLDAAVKNGDLTQSQADDMLSHLTEHLDDFGQFRRFKGDHRP